MVDCLEISDNPDRLNIKLFSHKFKSTLPLSYLFHFILSEFKHKKVTVKDKLYFVHLLNLVVRFILCYV